MFKPIFNYLNGVVAEFKNISFQSRSEVVRSVWTIIISGVLAVALLAVLDVGITALIQKYILK